MRGLDFALCRDPTIGVPVEAGVWAVSLYLPSPDDLSLVVYYTFDAEEVVLQSLFRDPQLNR